MSKLLAIDDTKDNLITISAILQGFLPGCIVITAESGMEGIKTAQEEQPDVILLDIKMPGMDGYEVCRRLKSDDSTRDIPIIILTGQLTDTDSKVKGLELGADAFLPKPISTSELIAQVKVMLRIKKAEDSLRKEKNVLDQLVWERTKELQESENKYRTLYECVGDAIIIHDDKANIMEVNPEACIRYGYSREEFIKMNVNEIDSPEQVENIPKRINTLFETGSVSFESVHLDKAGNQINVEINSRITEYGGKKAMISICRDITLRKKALEQIKVSLEEKEVLLQEIHHRVKNNMQIISGLLGLQMRSTNDKNANEALLDSQLRVQAMSYVHEILYSSENLSLIKMRTYLLCLTDTLTRSFGIAPAKVKTVVDVGELNLNIDQATPLGLIVNELVCNALKHAFPDDKEGKIIIKTQTDSQEGIRLTVSDNGIGIPDTLNWQKTDSLGLSLVRLLALRQLDGSIEMRQDHGTTFIVTFKQKK